MIRLKENVIIVIDNNRIFGGKMSSEKFLNGNNLDLDNKKNDLESKENPTPEPKQGSKLRDAVNNIKWKALIKNYIYFIGLGICIRLILQILMEFQSIRSILEILNENNVIINNGLIMLVLTVSYWFLMQNFDKFLNFLKKIMWLGVTLSLVTFSLPNLSLLREIYSYFGIDYILVEGKFLQFINGIFRTNISPFGLSLVLFAFIILIIIVLEIWIKYLHLESDSKKSGVLYESRKEKTQYLADLFNKNMKNMILIDGEWGIGKTYFVNYVIENKLEKNSHKIEIDVMLFNNKDQMIDYTLKEIKKILIKEGIRTDSVNQFKKIIRAVTESKRLKFTELLDEESMKDIEKEMAKDIEKLGISFYIIVDNLERVLNKPLIIDILGFLHKIYEFARVNIIVLADSENLGKNFENRNYLQKFFPNIVFLTKIDRNDILREEEERIKKIKNVSITIDSFKIVFDSFDKLINTSKDLSFFPEKIRSKFTEMELKLSNPRNIIHIIDKVDYFVNNYENKSNISDEEYIRQIIAVSLFTELNNDEKLKDEIKNLRLLNLTESHVNFENMDLKLINLYFEYLDIFSNPILEFQRTAKKNYLRLLLDIGIKEEKKQLEIIKQIIEGPFPKIEFSKLFDYFIEYIETYSKKEEGYKVYEKILNHLFEFPYKILVTNFSFLENIQLLKFDKQYHFENGKTIFDKIDGFLFTKEAIEKLINNAYLEEFYYFSKHKRFELHVEQSKEEVFFKELLMKSVELYEKPLDSLYDLSKEIVLREDNLGVVAIKFNHFEEKINKINNLNSLNLDLELGIGITERINRFKQLNEIKQETNYNDAVEEMELMIQINHLQDKFLDNFFNNVIHTYGNPFSKSMDEHSNRLYAIAEMTPSIFYPKIKEKFKMMVENHKIVWDYKTLLKLDNKGYKINDLEKSVHLLINAYIDSDYSKIDELLLVSIRNDIRKISLKGKSEFNNALFYSLQTHVLSIFNESLNKELDEIKVTYDYTEFLRYKEELMKFRGIIEHQAFN